MIPADQLDRAIAARTAKRDAEIAAGVVHHVQRNIAGRARPTVYAKSGSINFCFDNSGQPLVAPANLICHVGFTGRLVLADIIADVSGSATIDLKWRQWTDTSYLKAYGLGTIPTLTSAPSTRLAITTWLKYYQVQDVLWATLTSVSGGITSVTLSLILRKLPAPGFGTTELTAGGNVLVTAGGVTITTRH